MLANNFCCRNTVEQIHNEINTLEVRIKKIKKQIELSSTENEIKGQMTEFLQVSNTLFLSCMSNNCMECLSLFFLLISK